MTDERAKANALIDAQLYILTARESLISAQKLLKNYADDPLAGECNDALNLVNTLYFKAARQWHRILRTPGKVINWKGKKTA